MCHREFLEIVAKQIIQPKILYKKLSLSTARHRGLTACTFEVGAVISVDCVAENLDRKAINMHFNTVFTAIPEDDLHLIWTML